MSGVRRLLLDDAPGERRGVVLLDDRPERLLIERDGEGPFARLGARHVVRLAARGPGGGVWADLGEGPAGWFSRAPDGLAQGAAVEAEVAAEARADKGPRLQFRAAADGPPRRLAAAPSLEARLRAFADAPLECGPAAEAAADLAAETAVATTHALPGALRLTVETTRALAVVDVDFAPATPATPKRVQEANLRAVRHAARLLRLKGLGGTAVIDLIGVPAAGLVRAEAARAFAPDGPDVRVLPPDALGLLAVARPHGRRPVAEILLDADGALSARTLAQELARALRRELAAAPGARLLATCAPEVAHAFAPLAALLGPRVRWEAEPGRARSSPHIRVL